MLRRTGFKQPKPERKPMAWPSPISGGTVARCDAAGEASPKTEPKRNPHLLSMARGQRCLLMVPGVCNGNPETVVAAHSNLGIHGKAKGRKADDCYHIHSCSACHQWLDQGPWPAHIKTGAFMSAHLWMVQIWRDIADDFQHGTPKDRAAAQWALDQLNATPVGKP